MTQFTFGRRSVSSTDITESLPTDLDFGFNLEETDTWKWAQLSIYFLPHQLWELWWTCGSAWSHMANIWCCYTYCGSSYSGNSCSGIYSKRIALWCSWYWHHWYELVPFEIPDKISVILDRSSMGPGSNRDKTPHTTLKVKEVLRSE